VTVGVCQVRQVDVEVLAAAGATVLRIGDNQIPRPVGGQIAQVVHGASEHLVPICRIPAPRALAPLKAAPSLDDLWFGQVFNTRDSFADISRILARSSHRDHLQEDSVPPRDSSAKDSANHEVIPSTVLQCPFPVAILLRPAEGPRGLRETGGCFFSFSAQKEGLHAVSVETTEEEPIISSGWLPAAEAALDDASQ